MKKFLLFFLLSFIYFSTQAKSKSDVIALTLLMNGGDHTISTFIGSDIENVYNHIHWHGNSFGDEFGMPIYILSPKLVKYIECYIQFQSFFYPLKEPNESLFYYAGFTYTDTFGMTHASVTSVGGGITAKDYFKRMLQWINSYPSKKDSPELGAFTAFFKSYFIDSKGMLYTPLQLKRYNDRKQYEKHLIFR